MKKIILLLLITSYMMAANLLTYNIYDRSDRVDLMLSFDSPYDGQIFQDTKDNLITLKLKDLSYNKLIKKDINSKIVQHLTIEPNKNFLNIIIKSDNQIGVVASRTTDGFGLRIRIKLINKPIKTSNIISSSQTVTPAYSDTSMLDTRYISVVIILFLMLLAMFWIRKRFSPKSKTTSKGSWLFKKSVSDLQDIKILHKKQIDTNNSILLIEFENRKYLVMSGNSNLLLDTFDHEELGDKNEFEKAFNDNRKKLDSYLKLQDQKLEDYKKKASSDFHEEFNFYK